MPASRSSQGYRPVNSAARDGLHPGEATKARSNSTPAAATRSNPGVRTIVLP
ncbi:MAG: hypothetical protein R2834_24580 [Rhodothermales bacterium]